MSESTERNIFLAFVGIIIFFVILAHRKNKVIQQAASVPTQEPIELQIPTANGPEFLPDFGDDSIQAPLSSYIPGVAAQSFPSQVSPTQNESGCNCGGNCGANAPTQFSSSANLIQSLQQSPIYRLFSGF